MVCGAGFCWIRAQIAYRGISVQSNRSQSVLPAPPRPPSVSRSGQRADLDCCVVLPCPCTVGKNRAAGDNFRPSSADAEPDSGSARVLGTVALHESQRITREMEVSAAAAAAASLNN
jgi:hypothetical protein